MREFKIGDKVKVLIENNKIAEVTRVGNRYFPDYEQFPIKVKWDESGFEYCYRECELEIVNK